MTQLEELLEKAKSEICDSYCKWVDKYTDEDDLMNEKCNFCPLTSII